ncbi:hypothetical protein WDJ51_13220 [Rathayibacter sp. YIM 133350]|uniref:hypothetical protein n=1 Tax=Rathayibacter sp. YIM 133350 TaxID=3131992 RepID=UPI00307DCDDC
MTEAGDQRAVQLRGLYALNLIWTIPVALLAWYMAVSVARFSRCGIDQCLGDPGGWESPAVPDAIGATVFSAAILMVAIGIFPWLYPWRPRWGLAAVVALLSIPVSLYVVLFAAF